MALRNRVRFAALWQLPWLQLALWLVACGGGNGLHE